VLKKSDLFTKVRSFLWFIHLSGKILKDENTLEDYKIADGDTVHLVKGKSAASQSAPTTSTQSTQPTAA